MSLLVLPLVTAILPWGDNAMTWGRIPGSSCHFPMGVNLWLTGVSIDSSMETPTSWAIVLGAVEPRNAEAMAMRTDFVESVMFNQGFGNIEV